MLFGNKSSSILFLIVWALGIVRAFDFSISVPIQCENLTVSVQGGVPPYEVVLVPIGNFTPEVRRIVDLNFTGTSTSFQLKYPSTSEFSVVLSDVTGVGTGGTGIVQTVSASDDTTCLGTQVTPEFYFFMDPDQVLTQCAIQNISWAQHQGDITLLGLIPGGKSFSLPVDQSRNYYPWRVNVRAGTSVQLFVGDARGKGTGGSTTLIVVGDGSDSCIDASSPSSTAGSPAGSVTRSSSQTSTSITASSTTSPPASSTTNSAPSSSNTDPGNNTHKSNHVGAIVGGVVGGVIGLALIAGLLFFFCCRRRKDTRNEQTVDLMDGEDPPSPPEQGPPMIQSGYYQPEPFVIPEGNMFGQASSDQGHGTPTHRPSNSLDGTASLASGMALASTGRPSRDRRTSAASFGQLSESSDPTTTNTSLLSPPRTTRTGMAGRKHPPSAMRPANFVQHEDAEVAASSGAGGAPSEEVVELPPTYDDIRPASKSRRNSAAPSGLVSPTSPTNPSENIQRPVTPQN